MEFNIYGYKCKKCGTVHYPFRTACKKCGNFIFEDKAERYEIVPLSKKGKLLTWTRLRSLPGDFEVPELLLGIVQLDDGNRITGQLDIASPKTGMKVVGEVRVVRREGYNEHKGIVFETA
ncbi:MAG: OB-fold domain-containing protein [Elusimicrobia bacterium]|nr:OB-fold domain-containing protein [Elusimicrobiota bacterium]